jgi:predicted transcriptional regulator
MRVVSNKEFETNNKKYFYLALSEQVVVQMGDNMFIVQKVANDVAMSKSRQGWAEAFNNFFYCKYKKKQYLCKIKIKI